MTRMNANRKNLCSISRSFGSAIENLTSDLRPLTSDERGRSHGFTLPKPRERRGAFTLLELLIVVGIIGLLLVLMAPAFTYIKGGTDVTSAAYTIKGVLDTARTYAKANNTYTWVGFYEEDVSQPSTSPATARNREDCHVDRRIQGRNDMLYTPPLTQQRSDPTKLIQVGKLVKIDNVHLPIFESTVPTQ